MVEYSLNLDLVFGSLSDPTRRDILSRLLERDLSIGEIASSYKMTFAGISKHLKVMERAGLVKKHRRGNEQIVGIAPHALEGVDEYLDQYRQILERKLDALGALLAEEQRQ
jgi:DNA-binding transcriptional ArsR family regulator